jgi:hypothetical protein
MAETYPRSGSRTALCRASRRHRGGQASAGSDPGAARGACFVVRSTSHRFTHPCLFHRCRRPTPVLDRSRLHAAYQRTARTRSVIRVGAAGLDDHQRRGPSWRACDGSVAACSDRGQARRATRRGRFGPCHPWPRMIACPVGVLRLFGRETTRQGGRDDVPTPLTGLVLCFYCRSIR